MNSTSFSDGNRGCITRNCCFKNTKGTGGLLTVLWRLYGKEAAPGTLLTKTWRCLAVQRHANLSESKKQSHSGRNYARLEGKVTIQAPRRGGGNGHNLK